MPLSQDQVSWLFLDLNSYFASVEQQVRPELRNRPVAVVPVMADTTCCIAASYEAKAYGVKTGVSVKEAKRLCHPLVLVEARHELYVDFHHRILKAIDSCLPITKVVSIDEMACRLMGRERLVDSARKLAHKIKSTIYREAGECLRCSIGLGPNRLMAKTASNMQKPDGLVSILTSDLPACLYRMQPTDLPGIGHRMKARLERRGIFTMEQLCALTSHQMRALWGSVVGERFWHWLRGEDFDEPQFLQGSIGHQHVLPPTQRTMGQAGMVLEKLLHKAAARLRRRKMWAGGISLYVSFSQGREKSIWESHARILECQDTITLMETFRKLWTNCPAGRPTFVGVALFDLLPEHQHTLPLLEDENRRCRIAGVMDSINDKYGSHMLYVAGSRTTREPMPPRIAFSYIPEIEPGGKGKIVS